MINYVYIPELKLSKNDKFKLLDHFNQVKDSYGKKYVTSSGRTQDLTVVADFPHNDVIDRLLSYFSTDMIYKVYYLSNNGIDKHKDDNRQCVISFTIKNDENIPLIMYDDKTDSVVDVMYYGEIPVMWNTQVRHGTTSSIDERIFFQIELSRNHPFNHFLENYKNNNLLKGLDNVA